MAVIIKDFEMPKNCKECEFNNHCGDCLAGYGGCDYISETRPKNCPLIEFEPYKADEEGEK